MNFSNLRFESKKRKPQTAFSLAVLFCGLVFAPLSFANNPEEKGLAIAKEVEFRDRGWGDITSDMKMELTDKQGRQSSRELSMKTLEVPGDGDKSLTTFNTPRDVKGTAFLSFSHALKPDQQWLYLPALKRVKRISSSNKSGPFLGSEFAFEDLASFEVEKFKYEHLRDDEMNGKKFYVVKYVPQYPHSGYKYQEAWIDQEEYRLFKMVYFDRKGDLLKTLEFKDFKQYLNKYWRADQLIATNHQSGKRTTLTWENYKFKTGLTDKDFNKNTLKRAR